MHFFRETTIEELNRIASDEGVVYVLTKATNNHGLPNRQLYALSPVEVEINEVYTDKNGEPALKLTKQFYEGYTIYPTLEDVNEKIKSVSKYWFYTDKGHVIGWNLPYNVFREARRKYELRNYIVLETKNPKPKLYWKTIINEGYELLTDLSSEDCDLLIKLLGEYEKRARDKYKDYDYVKEPDLFPYSFVNTDDLWNCSDEIKKALDEKQSQYGYTIIARAIISFLITNNSMMFCFRSKLLAPKQEDRIRIRTDLMYWLLWHELNSTNSITDTIAEHFTEAVYHTLIYSDCGKLLSMSDISPFVIYDALEYVEEFINTVIHDEFGLSEPNFPEVASFISATKILYPDFASVSSGDIQHMFPFDTEALKKKVRECA